MGDAAGLILILSHMANTQPQPLSVSSVNAIEKLKNNPQSLWPLMRLKYLQADLSSNCVVRKGIFFVHHTVCFQQGGYLQACE